MGNCPTMINPEGDSFYYDIVKCMSLDNHHDHETFLVIHEYDEDNLINKEEIEHILEKEFQDYLMATGTTIQAIGENNVSSPTDAADELDVKTIIPPQEEVSNINNITAVDDDKIYVQPRQGAGHCALVTPDEESSVLCHGPLFVETTLKPFGDVLRLQKTANFGEFYTKRYLQKPPQPIAQLHSMPVVELVDVSMDNKHYKNPVEEMVPSLVAVYSQESDSIDAVDIDTENKINKEPIKLSWDGSPFLDLVVQGELGIVTRDDDINASKRTLQIQNNTIKPRLLLLNEKTGELIAMCCVKSLRAGIIPAVRVYSPKPRFPDVVPTDIAAQGVTYNERPLYLWAELNAVGEFPLPVHYSISLANESGVIEAEPSYRGKHIDVGKICIKMMGKTNKEDHHLGCCLICMIPNTNNTVHNKVDEDEEEDENTHNADDGNTTNNNTDINGDVCISISVARGVDPALFICLTSFIDELLESAMRRQVARIDQKLLIKRQHSIYSCDSE